MIPMPAFLQRLFLLSLAVLGLAACSTRAAATPAPLPTSTPPPTLVVPSPTPTFLPPPTMTPYPTATPGGLIAVAPRSALQPTEPGAETSIDPPGVDRSSLIFTTGFSQGWPTIEDGEALIRYEDGDYVFDLEPGNLRFLTTTLVDARDFYAELQATPDRCPAGGGYGMFARYADANNYYALTVYCDNRVTVLARVDGALQEEPLVSAPLPDGVDAASPVLHVVGLWAKGDEFAIYFDGREVTTFTSDLHDRGDVGVMATSAPSGALRVAFGDLGVWTVQ